MKMRPRKALNPALQPRKHMRYNIQNSWTTNFKSYKIELPEKLITQVVIPTQLAIFLTRLAEKPYQLEGWNNRHLMYKWINKLAQFIFVTCLLRELRALIFATQDKNCIWWDQELTTWSVASVTSELLYGMIFPRSFVLKYLSLQ